MGWLFGRKKKEPVEKVVAKPKSKLVPKVAAKPQAKGLSKSTSKAPGKKVEKTDMEKPLPDVAFNLLHPEFKMEPVMSAIEKISELDDVTFEKLDNECTVDFKRDGKKYRAILRVDREKSGAPTYALHATILTDKGKEFVKKYRTGLGYAQVEPAAVFVFSQAFSEY